MTTEPCATVIADSISEQGHRLLTIEATMHRFVLAEFNTHRVFSRNSASSRAIPVAKQLERVKNDPAMPVEWGTNQKGMQAAEPLSAIEEASAELEWVYARSKSAEVSSYLSQTLNVHKQLSNRLLEPWMWHTVIFSTTELDNFFAQRCSPLAQPEIRVVAERIRDAVEASIPNVLQLGEYHTPYIQPDEQSLELEVRKRVSAARCARVSYLTHAGVRDIQEDLTMFDRLTSAFPPHASPLEHVATPYPENIAFIEDQHGHLVREVPILGNFVGYLQLRHEIAGERIAR